MEDLGVRFERGFSLHNALSMLEEDVDALRDAHGIIIFPPENACGHITDEDSGDEDFVTINNLPSCQLRAPGEIEYRSRDDGFSSDDNLPLSTLRSKISSATKKKIRPKNKKIYHWVKEEFETAATVLVNEEPPTNIEHPTELFSYFFDDDIFDRIVRETNSYARSKNRTNEISISEMKCFIGVLILSGYTSVSRRRMYWELASDAHNDLVANAISRNKFEYILSNFHVIGNNELNKNDKFAKVRPLFDHLNRKFMEHSYNEPMHCVDECMVPYFGQHGCKQYIQGKPIRYGYKLWVGTTRTGYINWLEPYQGASTHVGTTYTEHGVGACVVLEYADALRKKWPDEKIHLFFDNFFTSIHLLELLSEKEFYATGTIRENRVPNNPLIDSKQFKKQKRGSFDYAKDWEKNIMLVKWNDNNLVSICSNFTGITPLGSVKRYSRKERKIVQINQPHLVNLYNNNMGGVDRSDQNISLYRVSLRGKRWYFPLVAHSIDMAVQNAWQLHRRKGGMLDQLHFRRRIATMLLSQNKKEYTYSTGHNSSLANIDLRYDRLDHLVIPQSKQTRCAFCHERTTTRCKKCDIGVHVKCFVGYHTKK